MDRIDPGLTRMVEDLSARASAYRESIVILTANRADVFSRIGETPRSAAELARELGWDPRACTMMLHALTALGLLEKSGDRFGNTETSRRLLVRDSPDYQGDILNHNLNLWARWSRLGEVLRSGRPLRDPGARRTGEDLRHFIRGMANVARLSAVRLLEHVDLAGRRKLLDVGGGPGEHALAACRRYPELEAVVFDLPEVAPLFEEQRARSGVGERAVFHAGDMHTDPFPHGCDVALVSNIIHSLGEAQNRALLAKIDAVLEPGGLLLVKDFFLDEDRTSPASAALFAINMLLGTEAGGCYTRSDVESWLAGTRCRPRELVPITKQSGVLVAERLP